MNRRRFAITMIAVAAIGLLAYRLRGVYMFLDIPPHIGDGEFQNISRRDGPLVMNGYRINSDPIDLSNDYERKMAISRLPNIGVNCKLFFVIEGLDNRLEERELRHRLGHAKTALELKDSRGKAIASIKGYLRDLVLSTRMDRLELYPLPFHVFAPDSNESYTLTISYTGDPKLASINGYAWIQCGGRK